MSEINKFVQGVSQNSAEAAFGPNSLLWHGAAEFRRDASPEDRNRFLNAVSRAANASSDSSQKPRAEAFRDTLRQSVATGKDFAKAAEQFEASISRCGALPKLAQVDADSLKVLKAEHDLPYDRVGGWMVYDMLWHLAYSSPGCLPSTQVGVVREVIATLWAQSNSGAVLRFVVEQLPGPAGLVTPDWWPMGLAEFAASSDLDEMERERFADFLASTQKWLSTIAQLKKIPQRLRWRLEPWRVDQYLNFSMSGRSAEAAVCCAGLAIKQKPDYPGSDMLNPCMAISAKVEGDPEKLSELRLAPVGVSFPSKLSEAAKCHLNWVLHAPNQEAMPKPSPVNLFEVGTLEAAYAELSANTCIIRDQHELNKNDFEKLWFLETVTS